MNVKNFSLFVLVALPFIAFAQTNVCLNKTYGFARTVVGGAPPVDVVEVGGKVVGTTGGTTGREYFLYLQTCYVNSVTITAVWVNGDGYSAKAEKTKSPVIITNTSLSKKGTKETLVNKTTSSVWQIVLSPDDTMLKPPASIQKLIKANAVVVTGYLKGKAFTTSLKNLKELQPFAAQ